MREVVLFDLDLGLPASTVDRIPPNVAQVKIMEGDQVGFLQDAVAALQGLGIVLPALSKYVIDDVIGKGRHDLLVPIALAAGGATIAA